MKPKKNYNAPLPNPPGLDLNDPKTLAGARAVATRKNNQFKKMIDERLPLFKEELMSGFEPFTAEKIIERRKEFRANYAEWRREFNESERRRIRELRTKVRSLAQSDQEFFFLMRLTKRLQGGGRFMKWYRVLKMVERRRTTPLSNNADLVLAWLEQETLPVTEFDIWEKRGDGLTPDQILNALIELMEIGYAEKIDLVVLPEKYHSDHSLPKTSAWTWIGFKEKGA